MSRSTVSPKLAVVYHPYSMAPMDVMEAARGVCGLIWVLDLTDPLLLPLVPLIRRLGEVVDTAGLDQTQITERVAAHSPDGIITFAEQLPLAASIASALGLRFHSRGTADLLTNKYQQRTALAQAGIPGPAFWPVYPDSTAAERTELARHLTYPVVLKPQDGLGSRQTHLVPDAVTLLRLLDPAQPEGEALLVEELLAEAHPRPAQRFGDVLMVDSLVSEGRFTHLVVAGHFIPAPPFRGTGSFIPSQLDKAETAAVLEATEAAAKALGIVDSFINTDLILTPDGPRVLEVNGRIGGEVARLLALVGAPPLIPQAMRFAVGQSNLSIAPPQTDGVAFCMMYQPPMPARRLADLGGLDVVARLPGVKAIVPNRRVGDALDWREGTISRLFSVYGVASDHDHLYHLEQQIRRSVEAHYELADDSSEEERPG